MLKQDFQESIRSGIHLVIGERANVDFDLRVGTSQQQISVTADTPIVSTSTEDVSGLVNEHQIEGLPLNGRSYDELLTLNPGVVNFTSEKTGGVGVSNSTVGNNFAVSGNRPQQNLFLLNGIEFTGAAENNMQPGGTSQQLLGVDAVQRVQRSTRRLQRGLRQASGRASADRDTERHGSSARIACTSSCATTIWTRAISSIRASTPGFRAQPVWSIVGRSLEDRTRAFCSETTKHSYQHLHQTGVDLVPDNNARNGYLPCKLVTPTPYRLVPPSGLAFVGVSPLGCRLADSNARALPISAGSQKHSITLCKLFAMISERRDSMRSFRKATQ